MKVSAIKSSSKDSPKTPGGISRSLLTPCRRVGLSRNFRKSGTSPFQSPLSSNTEIKETKQESRKRKETSEEVNQTPTNDVCSPSKAVGTPNRNIDMPRRKKSKSLLASINKGTEDNELPSPTEVNRSSSILENNIAIEENDDNTLSKTPMEVVSTPVRLKSKSRSKKKISPSKTVIKEIPAVDLEKENFRNNLSNDPNKAEASDKKSNEISPNNLTKECIVVIQKKIFKNEMKEITKTPKSKEKHAEKANRSQVLFDSDSDDVPLNRLNTKDTIQPLELQTIDEDNDFTTKPVIKTTMTTSTKSPTNKKNYSRFTKDEPKPSKPIVKNLDIHKPNSQSSAEDDDDFFEKKRTILIRKSYDKVLKPQKAKSTGSITQKDIDELKARIDMKKKLLLVRGMSEDTTELRDLIKKWQKGCQDALMELMDLMKNKFPDKQNMDYSHMLQTLKIPASIVGYDSDNDCFLTPDDENIILGNLK